jgi:hypothetical protein
VNETNKHKVQNYCRRVLVPRFRQQCKALTTTTSTASYNKNPLPGGAHTDTQSLEWNVHYNCTIDSLTETQFYSRALTQASHLFNQSVTGLCRYHIKSRMDQALHTLPLISQLQRDESTGCSRRSNSNILDQQMTTIQSMTAA